MVDQNYDAAIFQDQGSAPATLEAARICDFYGCSPGHDVDIADAEQAYVQADMRGTDTYVCLPDDERPSWWKKEYGHVRRPVC